MDYITIIQGDDTNFLEDQFVVVNFNTDIDLSGFTATFTLGDVTLTYGNLSGKTFEIILSNEITSNLKIGKQYGELKLIDNSDRIRTVSSVIPFIVKKGVDETITFVNSSLNVSMNINDTVIDIYVETSGISKTEAQRILANCRDAEQAASNYSNTAQNALIGVTQAIENFNEDYSDLTELINDTQETYENNLANLNSVGNQKIAQATAQADRAEASADHVDEVLKNSSDSDLTKLSSAGLDKINQSKALETGSVSNYASVYNQILAYKNNAISSGVDIIESNYSLPNSYYGIVDVDLTVNSNGITSGLYDSSNYVLVDNVSIPNTAQINFNIHIESILRNGFNHNTTYFGASTTNALMLQLQANGYLMAYMYANDNNTKMLQTSVLSGMKVGDRLILDVGFNTEKSFYIKGTCNGVTVESNTDIGTAWIREAVTKFWYGKNSWSGSCYIEVDLLHSYFDINGNRIRPLMQIPYFLTKTGSKITTSNYLEFVQELYAKNGIAQYYTLDETNHTFTLPMGELYGMLAKKAEVDLSNTNPTTDFVTNILNALAPDTSVILNISSVATSSSYAYTAPCAGWYVLTADTSTRRYLYINNVQTAYSIGGTGQTSVSVFLGSGDRVYWSGSMSTTYSHKFIPAKGCHYVKTVTESLDDLLG